MTRNTCPSSAWTGVVSSSTNILCLAPTETWHVSFARLSRPSVVRCVMVPALCNSSLSQSMSRHVSAHKACRALTLQNSGIQAQVHHGSTAGKPDVVIARAPTDRVPDRSPLTHTIRHRMFGRRSPESLSLQCGCIS